MQRPAKLLNMLVAAALSACAVAPALAGNEIVKCIDASGHVTLTDQPCESGATMVKLSSMNLSGNMPQPQRHVVPPAELRHATWKRPHATRPATLSRDIATLKEARRMLMLQETRPRLAGLD